MSLSFSYFPAICVVNSSLASANISIFLSLQRSSVTSFSMIKIPIVLFSLFLIGSTLCFTLICSWVIPFIFLPGIPISIALITAGSFCLMASFPTTLSLYKEGLIDGFASATTIAASLCVVGQSIKTSLSVESAMN
ncbi:hypothetical protein SDC9_90997 [bioreactor metagenome]|uniref:Uncharacterized protein n=1 Tax=bioreactor metagenome TaxID=1076179 RepID=A0A644ZTI7_9ZZZZ